MDKRLLEKIADVQHKIWSHWMKYLFSVSEKHEDGSVTIPAEKVQRWMEQVEKSYDELSEKEKDSDREMANWVIIKLNRD